MLRKQLGQPHQYVVAALVPIGVIHLFEVVKVSDRHTEGLVPVFHTVLFDLLNHQAPVRQPRQGIGAGFLIQDLVPQPQLAFCFLDTGAENDTGTSQHQEECDCIQGLVDRVGFCAHVIQCRKQLGQVE